MVAPAEIEQLEGGPQLGFGRCEAQLGYPGTPG